MWKDMELLNKIFTPIYYENNRYKLGENIFISHIVVGYEWKYKYNIQTPNGGSKMRIDRLIEHIREYFPEYVRPLIIKCAKY